MPRVPLPPPRNDEELRAQIEYYEKSIIRTGRLTTLLWVVSIVGGVLVAIAVISNAE